jgi:lauroyl/myristoyl acyltransferase
MSLPPPVRRWRRRGFYVLVRTLAGSLRRLPKPVGRQFLRGIAGIAWAVLPRERKIARRQLARAFPDLAPASRDAVASASRRGWRTNSGRGRCSR